MPIKTRVQSKDICLCGGKATYDNKTVAVSQLQAQKPHVI